MQSYKNYFLSHYQKEKVSLRRSGRSSSLKPLFKKPFRSAELVLYPSYRRDPFKKLHHVKEETISPKKGQKVLYVIPVILLFLSSLLYFHPVFTTPSGGSYGGSSGTLELETMVFEGASEEEDGMTSSGEETNFIKDSHAVSIEKENGLEDDTEHGKNLDGKIPIESIGEFVDEEEVEVDVNQINPYEEAMEKAALHEEVRDFVAYRVRHGDTLWLVANRFKVSIDTLISLNKLRSIHHLSVGKWLRIPPYSGLFYTVKAGDTLISIAQTYDIPLSEVEKYNEIEDYLIAGTTLFLNKTRYDARTRQHLFGTLFMLPLSGGHISSRYGMRKHPIKGVAMFHTGIDVATSHGERVLSAAKGEVVFSGEKGEYGQMIEVKHRYGYTTVYAHLARRFVRKGERIQKGGSIGLVGSTGGSTGPHLHFEIKSKGKYVNPLRFLRF